jgi:flavin reductase
MTDGEQSSTSNGSNAEPEDLASQAAKVPLYKHFPSSIAVITSWTEGHNGNAMACEWTMNISYHPFLVLSLIEAGDCTHQLISESGQFGVNIVSADQAAIVNAVGRSSGWQGPKLQSTALAGQIYPARKIAAPMLRGCVLNLECLVERTISFGDYTGFVGRVVAGRANAAATPLIYFRGAYHRMGDLIPKPEAVPAEPVALSAAQQPAHAEAGA